MTGDPRFLSPWRLLPHRVKRFYRGGRLLDEFRGVPAADASDGDRPEDWVGSATRAWTPPGSSATDEGLGDADIGGEVARVSDLLVEDPVAVAGAETVNRFGVTTGVLVKLLDAAVRLPIHCHPSREFARRHLASPFGKAEAWIILRTRAGEDDPPPTVRIGFRRDVGRDELIDWIEAGRTEVLLDAMHERPTRAGDVWFIPPGVPHAIGAGIFMLEVEEPSDFSIVAETRDVPIHPADAHLGLGWGVAIDAFDREGHDDSWVDGLVRHPVPANAPSEISLADPPALSFFQADRLTIGTTPSRLSGEPRFLVGAVLSGEGSVRTEVGHLAISAGDTFALPAAAVGAASLVTPVGMELIICRGGNAR
jgi:mannose-6-phosphate isomerase